MKRKKIAIIGTVGVPACYGGFETLAAHLVEELQYEMDFTVYCSAKHYPKSRRQHMYHQAQLVYLPFKANGIQSIIYDCISMIHVAFYADVLLVLGVPGAFLLPLLRMFTSCRIITSIDGIEWKRNKWHKYVRWYLWIAEWFAVKYSHEIIADNESIQDYTAVRYQSLSNIIEYGADHVLTVKPQKEDYREYPFLTSAYAIKVCRIEPENNIEMVLKAFSRLERHPLVLVGNWKNSVYGEALRARYEGCPNLYLLDPVYDSRKIDMLRGNATLYIHGHSAGGTNPSLVEAMYLGLPVIAYDVAYNKTTTELKALYFRDEQELETIIRDTRLFMLKKIGREMASIAYLRYTWQVVASKYAFLIQSVTLAKRSHRLNSMLSQRLSVPVMLRYQITHMQYPSFFYEKR